MRFVCICATLCGGFDRRRLRQVRTGFSSHPAVRFMRGHKYNRLLRRFESSKLSQTGN
jgi:hypothetical protein